IFSDLLFALNVAVHICLPIFLVGTIKGVFVLVFLVLWIYIVGVGCDDKRNVHFFGESYYLLIYCNLFCIHMALNFQVIICAKQPLVLQCNLFCLLQLSSRNLSVNLSGQTSAAYNQAL